MDKFITTFLLFSTWIKCSIYFHNLIDNIDKQDKEFIKTYILSLLLGFIFTFSLISSLNIFLHFFGITIVYSNFLIPLPFIILFYRNNDNLKFVRTIFKDLKLIGISLRNFILNKKIFSITFLIIFLVQIISLIIRSSLPVSHGDALSMYFYDSLQISRLENITINEYYNMGQYFRTDSLASFFDASILQLCDYWYLTKFIRAFSLILIILGSLEMSYNIGFQSIKRSLTIVLIILTLPDIWDIALSGKHDCYVLLFELTGIYLISLSLFCKNKTSKTIFSLFAVIAALLSISIRLSSIYLLLISLIFIIYNFYQYPISEIKPVLSNIYERIRLSKLILIILIIIPSFAFGMLNYKFFSNPFYKLSPPSIVSDLFPNYQYIFPYEAWKIKFSLRNIPFLFKPFATFFYTTLGLEPIRYISNKLSNINGFLGMISYSLNRIGPEGMMVSLFPLSPFSILAYFSSTVMKNKKRLLLLILISIWIFFWTISIPFTRVALASFLSLVIFAFSDPKIFHLDQSIYKINNRIKSLIIYYGYITIFLFSIWSFSTLYDLPIGELFRIDNYSRTSLTRKYIDLKNNILKTNYVSPNLIFEKEWSKIEKNNNSKLLFLKDAPNQFAYFMNKGLIVSDMKEISKKNKEIALCYEIDNNQNIFNINCTK